MHGAGPVAGVHPAPILHVILQGLVIANAKSSISYIALQDMLTFKNQAKIMLPFLVTLLLIKVSNCA